MGNFFFKDEPVMIKRPTVVDTIPTNIRPNLPKSPKKDPLTFDNKLQRLEQLQYALTKQVRFSFFFFSDKNKTFLFCFLRNSKIENEQRNFKLNSNDPQRLQRRAKVTHKEN